MTKLTLFKVLVTRSTQNNKENGERITKQPKIKSGVEKDEEREYHLQQAIVTQNESLKGAVLVASSIPIPRVHVLESCSQTASTCLRASWSMANRPAELIKQVPADAYCMRENVYEADEEDAEFLETARCINAGLSMNELEDLIAAIENQARKTIISWPVAQAQLRHISMEKLALVYDYWAEKRRKILERVPLGSIIPIVPAVDPIYEECTTNPYVAFRRREYDLRRRSLRIAQPYSSSTYANRQREMTADERRQNEAVNQLEARFNIHKNSEIDGIYAFRRDPRCSYQMPRPLRNELG